MGSSNKKKKEKKQDFQKPKLKVGKAKPKPSNFTDTSFRSKAIVLQKQLNEDVPDLHERFKHYLSLTASRSDSQRRDALAYLTGQLSTSPPFNPVGTSTVLSKLLPLMTDATGSVRSQLLKLLRTLPAHEVRPDVEKIMRYIRGGMTHISQEIKDDGLNYMEWLLETAGAQVVESPGCWVKPLKDFAAILGWATLLKPVTPAGAAAPKGKGGWTSAPRTTFGAKKHGASFPRQMLVLAQFLEHGFRAPTPTAWAAGDWFANLARLPAGTPDPYGYVGLFAGATARGSAAGGGGDEEDARSYRDRDDRQAVFGRRFADAFRRGVDEAKREGGMAGRAAAQLDKVLREGMEGYDQETRRCNENEGLWNGYIM